MYKKGDKVMTLNNEELQLIVGGASKIGIGIVIGGIVTLLVGIFDGFLRPLRCNK